MSETEAAKGMPAPPSTGGHDSVLAKKAEEARGSNKIDEVLAATGAMGQAISTEVQKVIIGKSHVIDNVMVDILSNGNLLFEDFPGLAKTLMTNTFADALGCDFKRVQFTLIFFLQISRGLISMMPRKESLLSSPDQSSAIFFFPTRLTGHRPRLKQHCLKQCRKSK